MSFPCDNDEILGKRKNREEEKEDIELKKIKNEDVLGVPLIFLETEPGIEDRSKSKVDSTETTRIDDTEQDRSEESSIKNLLIDALDIVRTKIEVENTDVERAYDEIKEKFRRFKFTEIDFNSSDYLIAYFYEYSLFNSTLSRNRFLDAFENCQQLQNVTKARNLKVVSLGGGPGTDIIGFCSALQDFGGSTSILQQLSVTVVDIWERWASFYNVIEFLIREGNYGNVSKLFESKDVFSSFMKVDILGGEPPSEYSSKLNLADIVLLVRVLDAFDFKETDPDNLMRGIIRKMKRGALLLVIDTYYNTRDFIDSAVTQIYKSNVARFFERVKLTKMFSFYSKSSEAGIFIFMKN